MSKAQKEATALYDAQKPPMSGYKRDWYVCDCGALMCRDFVPYSTSSPVLTTTCGHRFEDLKKLKQ